MEFGSWTLNANYLNLTITQEYGDDSGFKNNSEWELLGFPARLNAYDFEGNPYITAIFVLRIRRRTLYYFSNLILPCVLQIN